MKHCLQILRRVLVPALLVLLFALPVQAEGLGQYAAEGDYDYINLYEVTVELREDGSADITYAIDWQVLAGDKSEYLAWVKVGLANRHIGELVPLTDTIGDLQYSDDGGDYAKVVLARRYYSPEAAAENGGPSRVQFAFRVHQSHLFTRGDDGTASFAFTPGWFDEICVEKLVIRWKNGDGFIADNTGVDGDYLLWEFGPLAHGERAVAHVTVPVTLADTYDPSQMLTAEDYPSATASPDEDVLIVLLILFFVFLGILLVVMAAAPGWGGGFGRYDAADWFWYTNGIHTIRRARHLPPPQGYHRTDPPKGFSAGGGQTRGGGVGRHGGGCACVSSCACAASCACACACAGGGRAGCSAKNFYAVKLRRILSQKENAQ